MAYSAASRSLVAFGAAMILGSIIAAYFLDALMVDFLAVVVVTLGTSVSSGSRRACGWSIAIMALYLLLAALILLAGAVSPESLRVGARPVRAAELPWALAAAGSIGVWSLANIILLVRAVGSTAGTLVHGDDSL